MTHPRFMRLSAVTLLLPLLAAPLCAQTSAPPASAQASAAPQPLDILKDRPDALPGAGSRFESAAAGISFDVPAGMSQMKKNGEEIVRYADEKRNWELIAAKSVTKEPIPLTAGGQFQRSGIMELVVSQIKGSNPGTDIARQDVIDLGPNKAGMIAARFTVGTQRRLLQQVVVQANDQLYYTVTLTSRAARKDADEGEADPEEQAAVEAFNAIVDSIKLSDLGAIRQDQEDRVIRTRALFVSLTPDRVKTALVPEQWLRLLKDGKDMGYTYVIEEPDTQGAAQGIKIGMRSRTRPDDNTQADGETWYFMSFDRRHETWSNLAFVQDKKTGGKTNMSEIGSSDATVKRVFNPKLPTGVIDDDKQPPVDEITTYDLTVTKAGKTTNTAPLKMRLPPFYLPQALGHILPRVVPLATPKTYMFYMYVSDQNKVMTRYVDVGQPQNVNIMGQAVQAIPITDRIGLEGSPVTHYMSPQGKYLATINPEQHTTIVPSDADTLQKIWANANLTRPPVPDAAKP
ncbi:MAG TPA: hypothetical protein VF669_22190 [Tepidisphaeraceae bacterium]